MTRFVICLLVVALLVTSCGLRRVGKVEPKPEDVPTEPVFDPLAIDADRTVVPEEFPIHPAKTTAADDTIVSPANVSNRQPDSAASGTTPSDVYRVQIFTSRLYSEATREMTIAEEIFNLPIFLDYEVPYYKLRVGEFATRDEAEDMLPEIKAIGYPNAWVARVLLRVHDVPEYDLSEEPILPELPGDSTAPPVEDSGTEPEGEDR